MLRSVLKILTLCGGLVVPSLVWAEPVREARFGFGLGVSTLGLTGDVAYHVNPNLGLRVMGGFGEVSANRRVGDISFSGSMRTGGVGPMVDLYPFANGWRVTGGLLVPLQRVSLSAVGPVRIGDTVYADVDLHARLTPRDTVQPMIALGYDGGLSTRARNGRGFSRMGLVFDVGAIRGSGYRVGVTDGSGLVSGPDLDRVLRDVNDRLGNPGWTPFVRLGLRMHF